MPTPDYDGDTFVAFTDISGFKEMMKRDELAVNALHHFYNSGYDALREGIDVHGFFISDCAILFVSNHDSSQHQLRSLLSVVEDLNRRVLKHNLMLTTSIAHGRFAYHQRVEFEGITKNPVYGNAYVAAFLDNESGKPPIQPGQCRIVNYNEYDFTSIEPRLEQKGNHILFHWMIRDCDQIRAFTDAYSDAYQQKYRGMLEALKEAANQAL